MCRACVAGYAEEDPRLARAAHAIRKLYSLPGCATGGPLHVIVDDTNVEDEYFNILNEIDTTRYPETTMAVAREALDLLRPLSAFERAYVIVYHEEIQGDCQ